MTLVECLVALALAGVVSAAVVAVLTSQSRLVRTLTARASDADAHRITAGVLRAELRLLDPAVDVRAIAADSLGVRLYRGAGGVCARADDRLLVLYAGDRLPDPTKDSVLVQGAGGQAVQALAGAEATTCGGRPALALRLEGVVAPYAAAVLVFESGTYFLRDRALRYRLGAAGRQPITDERFAPFGPPLHLDSTRVLVPVAWPREERRPADTLRIHFANLPG